MLPGLIGVIKVDEKEPFFFLLFLFRFVKEAEIRLEAFCGMKWLRIDRRVWMDIIHVEFFQKFHRIVRNFSTTDLNRSNVLRSFSMLQDQFIFNKALIGFNACTTKIDNLTPLSWSFLDEGSDPTSE